jgi:hypothetical protein
MRHYAFGFRFVIAMNEPGTSAGNVGFTHSKDTVYQFPDSDSEGSNSGDDDDSGTDPQLMKELEMLLLHMLELVEEYYKHLVHPEIVRIDDKWIQS